jgi:hypothetical protein
MGAMMGMRDGQMRRPVQRRIVDYTGPAVTHLMKRQCVRDPQDDEALQPTLASALDVRAPRPPSAPTHAPHLDTLRSPAASP